jgi:hypothetical protein
MPLFMVEHSWWGRDFALVQADDAESAKRKAFPNLKPQYVEELEVTELGAPDADGVLWRLEIEGRSDLT